VSSDNRTQKLESLMHYIIWKCQDPTMLGAVKLNKILWYSDLFAYLEKGRSITGIAYIKRQFGPVPKSEDFIAASEKLKSEGKIAVTEGMYYGKPYRQFVALKLPNISMFSPEEISIIDIMVEEICQKHTALSISKLSHDIIWESAEIGEEIPLCTAFAARFGEITEDDIQWAKREAKRLGMY
jgi:hypothetical protein